MNARGSPWTVRWSYVGLTPASSSRSLDIVNGLSRADSQGRFGIVNGSASEANSNSKSTRAVMHQCRSPTNAALPGVARDAAKDDCDRTMKPEIAYNNWILCSSIIISFACGFYISRLRMTSH